MSLKIKLFLLLAVSCLVIAIMIVGIYSAQFTQLSVSGTINFDVDDKSLYLQDVWMQEDNSSEPYSLKQENRFSAGYINGEFIINLGNFTNNFGSFSLYFDILNTLDENNNSNMYDVSVSTTQIGEAISIMSWVLNDEGYIPFASISPDDITSSTQPTAQVKLTIVSSAFESIDLSQITITITKREPQVIDDYTFTYNDNNNTATVRSYIGDGGDIVIPSTISRLEDGTVIEGNQYTVTGIYSAINSSLGVFSNENSITGVNLPKSLQTIGDYAFYNCSGLEEITFPSALTSIGENAFENCDTVVEIDLSNCIKLEVISFFCFRNCTSLTTVAFPKNLVSIENSAFSGCGVLSEININVCTNLESIGNYAFSDCSALSSELDFSQCTSLTNIGDYAFDSCLSITSIIFPTCLESIGNNAFSTCRGLTGNLNLASCQNLQSIGNNAFEYCDSFTSVTFPDSLSEIGRYAFDYCGFTSVDLSGCENLTTLSTYVFAWCSNLKSVTLPANLVSIGDFAFYYCSGILELNLSACENLKSIGDNAFRDCEGIEMVDLSACANLISIGDYTFNSCGELASVLLPSKLNSLGRNAFSSCSRLNSVEFGEITGWQVSTSSDFSGEVIEIDSTDLQTPSTASGLLGSTYSVYYWRKV